MAYADVAASQAKSQLDQLAQTINAGTTFNFGNGGKGDTYSNELGQKGSAEASASASLGGNAASAIGGGIPTIYLEIAAVVIVAGVVGFLLLHHKHIV